MKTKISLSALWLLAVLLASACSARTDAGSPLGTWKLVSYGPASASTPALPDVNTRIAFDQDGTFAGSIGCNSFSGSYQLAGDKLTFGSLISTLMACDDARMQQETGVLRALNGTQAFKLEGQRLTISYDDGASALVLEKAEEP